MKEQLKNNTQEKDGHILSRPPKVRFFRSDFRGGGSYAQLFLFNKLKHKTSVMSVKYKILNQRI